MDLEAITLPGGFEREGTWQRTVWLRALSGHDEALFAESGSQGGQAGSVTALLARVISVVGDARPAGPEFARELTVGDREAVLLHLRRITLGDRLSCVLSCPACGEKLDLDVQASELLLPPYPHRGRWHRASVEDGGEVYHVRFRLPTGADQEAVASLAARDVEAAVIAVLERCVAETTDAGGRATEELPPAVRRRLPGLMAELDPQAELMLEPLCPECQAPFTVPLDTARFLEQEMRLAGDALFREVHLLALHYHWGEAEIFGMTRRRRRRYLDLLAETMAEQRVP